MNRKLNVTLNSENRSVGIEHIEYIRKICCLLIAKMFLVAANGNELIIKLIFSAIKKLVARIVYCNLQSPLTNTNERSILNQGEHYNEKELLQNVAEGSETAFARLFHIWYPRLMSLYF